MKGKIAIFKNDYYGNNEIFCCFCEIEYETEKEKEREIQKCINANFECDCDFDEEEQEECQCEFWHKEVDLNIVHWDEVEEEFYTQEGLKEKEKRDIQEWIEATENKISVRREEIAFYRELNRIDEKRIEQAKEELSKML